jgi:hypothetical protein
LPQQAASTGPATTGSRQASATSWQNSGLATPPPTTWTVRTGRPVSHTASRTACLIATAMLSRMQRTISACPDRTTPVTRWHASMIRWVIPPGGRNTGSCTSMSAPSARTCPAAPVSSSRSTCPHSRTHSCSSQNPVTLRRNRVVPSTPPSLLNPAPRAASVMTGAGNSTPTSAHVPVQTNANSSPSAGTPATAAAVSCDGPMITCGGRARPRSAPAGPATSPAGHSRGNN